MLSPLLKNHLIHAPRILAMMFIIPVNCEQKSEDDPASDYYRERHKRRQKRRRHRHNRNQQSQHKGD